MQKSSFNFFTLSGITGGSLFAKAMKTGALLGLESPERAPVLFLVFLIFVRKCFERLFTAGPFGPNRAKQSKSQKKRLLKGVPMEFNVHTAERALKEASESNPGAWTDHSRYVAEACKNIAARCRRLSSEQAYLFGLLHDIGRYAGVSSERHLIDGYRYCMQRGWEKAAQICISHAFMIQDIDTSIGTFDVSDADYLFMKEFIANAV